MGRPVVPLIERSEAIRTALDIIDTEGVDAFSMRRLADRLGVKVQSMYHHFRSKDELLRGVHELVLGEVRFPKRQDTWQGTLVQSAIAYRKALLRHPNTISLMVQIPASNSVPRLYERYTSDLVAHGIDPAAVPSLMHDFEVLVLGSLMLMSARDSAEWDTTTNGPRLTPHARGRDDDRYFEELCWTLADGLTSRMAGEERRHRAQ